MLLTIPQLKALSAALDKARLESPEPGKGLYCTAVTGSPQWVPKPRASRPVGHVYPDGSKLEDRDGEKGVHIPPGAHGRGGLGVDPETGEVRCVLCEGKE
jgi:hypothetical protein